MHLTITSSEYAALAMSTMFKFVASDRGARQKRQQSQRACEGCRKRKKRCHHADVALKSSVPSIASDASRAAPIAPQGTFGNPQFLRNTAQEQQGTSQANSILVETDDQERALVRTTSESAEVEAEPRSVVQNEEARDCRFIGDLNPEGIFLAATSPDATRGDLSDSIGVWLRTSPQTAPISVQSPSNLFYRSGSLVQKVLVPMLEQECTSTIPPRPKVEALIKIYFEKVHPIFPIIDEEAYRNLDPRDPSHVLLQQGMCLAASKNFVARPHLIMAESSSPLSCREFGERLFGAMRISVEMSLISNKVVLIQALTLMSQFSDHPVGEDISSQLCGRAVHHVQSLGLHLKAQQESHGDRGRTTLLCCVWAIDRMNAAFNGRPVLMHERDVGQDLKLCFEQQAPCFRLFLHIIELLDKVIDLYRPLPSSGNQPRLDLEFPAFEDVVLRCGSSTVGTSALATTETLYHAVAILTCRSKTWADPEYSSIAYLRQSLSTSILSSTIIKELNDKLTLFPFIPYAASLSMSVAYREMRHSKLPLHRARSRAQFQTLCDALYELQGVFWSASTNSEMGRKLLKEMDRVYSTVSVSETRSPHQLGANNSAATTVDPSPISSFSNQNSFTTLPTTGNKQMPSHTVHDFDPSPFDSVADIDLFGLFDPAFDLDGFDACLEGNLNPAFPNLFQ